MLFELHPPDSFTQLWSVQTNGNIRELPPLALASLVPTVLLITLSTSELSRQLAKRWRNSTRTSMSTSWLELRQTTWTISLESRQNVSMTDRLLPYSLACFQLSDTLSYCLLPSVNVGDDCPVFDGLFEYCSISAGGSMGTPQPLPISVWQSIDVVAI